MKYEQIYSWAALITTEAIINQKQDNTNYYWTPEAEEVCRDISLNIPGLVAVIGLQGSGKTRLMYELRNRLIRESKEDPRKKNILLFKLKSDVIEFTSDNIPYTYVIDKTFYSRSDSKSKGKMFKKSVLKKPWTQSQILPYVTLIDLPDYSKKNLAPFSRALEDILSFWAGTGKIILFLQQELMQSIKHFAVGKMHKVYLKPLSSDVLVELYLKNWGSPQPFTKEALREIAEASRGIFRRFQKYIRKSLNKFYASGEKIELTPELIREIIDIKTVAEDMEPELLDLYPNAKEKRMVVVKILEHLRVHKSISQKELANMFFRKKDYGASRMLTKLESESYIIISRGRENIISLGKGS